MAGQIVMEGFINFRMRRGCAASSPAASRSFRRPRVTIAYGESGTAQLLILSQVS